MHQMQSLDNCPCCGGAWKPIPEDETKDTYKYDCDICNMVYYPTNKFLVRRDILGYKGYNLVWDLKFHTCEYGLMGEYGSMGKFIDDMVKLPMLQFNITPEKLKLY